jgi:hypothetical protein
MKPGREEAVPSSSGTRGKASSVCAVYRVLVSIGLALW